MSTRTTFGLWVLLAAACGGPPWENATSVAGSFAGDETAATVRSGETTHVRARRQVTLSILENGSHHVDVGPCGSAPLVRTGPETLGLQGEVSCEESLVSPGGAVTVHHRVTRVVLRSDTRDKVAMEATWERVGLAGDVDPTTWEFQGSRVSNP